MSTARQRIVARLVALGWLRDADHQSWTFLSKRTDQYNQKLLVSDDGAWAQLEGCGSGPDITALYNEVASIVEAVLNEDEFDEFDGMERTKP